MSAPAPAPARPGAAEHEAAAAVRLAFRRATTAVRRVRGRDTHRPGELSYAQFGLLFGLADHGELCAGDLAALADVMPSTATKMLDRLVEGGFVERVRGERDRRQVLVALTPRGSEVVAGRRTLYEELWLDALQGFSREQLVSAAAVLDRVVTMFDALDRERRDAR